MPAKKKSGQSSQVRWMLEYQERAIVRIAFNLNRNTRPKMLAYLEGIDNVNGYLKHLIAVDMKAKGIPTDEKDGE